MHAHDNPDCIAAQAEHEGNCHVANILRLQCEAHPDDLFVEMDDDVVAMFQVPGFWVARSQLIRTRGKDNRRWASLCLANQPDAFRRPAQCGYPWAGGVAANRIS